MFLTGIQDVSTFYTTNDPRVFRKKLGQFIKEMPSAVRMTITPVMAEIMLARNESDEWHNRPQSSRGLRRLTTAIRESRYIYTGDTIKFSETGRLLDGQHRLSAIIEAARPIDILVAFGIPDDAFKFIDIGIARTAAHILSIEGVPNSVFMSSTARLVAGYLSARSWSGTPLEMDNDEVLAFCLSHMDIQRSHAPAKAFRELIAPRWAGAMHYLCAQKSRTQADEFFERVASGVGITSKKSPEFNIRRRLEESSRAANDKKESDMYLSAYLIHSWNAYREGKTRSLNRWRGSQNPNEAFPRAI